MPKYIDATALLKAENDAYWEKYTNGGTVEADDIIHIALSKILEAAPAANVAPVVRCKDCKRWNRGYFQDYMCHSDVITGPNDFCSYGERKESNDENQT